MDNTMIMIFHFRPTIGTWWKFIAVHFYSPPDCYQIPSMSSSSRGRMRLQTGTLDKRRKTLRQGAFVLLLLSLQKVKSRTLTILRVWSFYCLLECYRTMHHLQLQQCLHSPRRGWQASPSVRSSICWILATWNVGNSQLQHYPSPFVMASIAPTS